MADYGHLNIKIQSKIWDDLLTKIDISEKEAFYGAYAYSDEDGPTGMIYEDPVESICWLLISPGLANILPESAYDESVDYEEEYYQGLDCCRTLEELIDFATENQEYLTAHRTKDPEDETCRIKCLKILELGKSLYEAKEAFEKEAYVYLGAGYSAWYRGMGPCFEYRRLEMDKGKGTLIEIYENECMDILGDPKGPFYRWALEHGYYEEKTENKRFEDGYKEWLAYDPPFEEYAESGPSVTKKVLDKYNQ